MLGLHSHITTLNRVGPTNSQFLKKLGLETIQDLLFYLPFRYDDFSKNQLIAEVQTDQTANIIGTIELIQNRRSRGRRLSITEALISDASDSLKVIWFNQPFLTRTLKIGDHVSLAGKITENHGQTVMLSPRYEKVYSADLIHTSGLVPNYHLTAELTNRQIRSLVKQIISLANQVPDWLPRDIRQRLNLLDLPTALKKIHFPESQADIQNARQRLSFSELFCRQLQAQLIKKKLRNRQASSLKFQEKTTREFVANLPFELTPSQKKAAWEILQDLEKNTPMNRLLEGDVGSGKTLVAIMALLNSALNKKRAILMAPTTILAQQHFQTVSKFLGAYPFKIGLLTSQNQPLDYQELDIIIGTQALIQKKIDLKNLGLVIVDEQQRFGVSQRHQLLSEKITQKDIRNSPHFLSMTATPIPRSLALSIYGDLDLSIINQLPSGRKKIITQIITEDKRKAAYDFLRTQIKAGRQVFVICPLIEESDKLGVKSVKQEHKKLDQEIFPDLSVGLLHGRLKTAEKEKIMTDFLDNKLQILVSTSLIEVGVDVPNATIMLIEGAERFGLAQLHQFRGRVGRGPEQAYCFLGLSQEEGANSKTIERLQALTKYQDGFSLAKIDLAQRGAGELYGHSQSGFPELQIASLFDYDLIKKAQEEAKNLLEKDPDLSQHPLLKNQLGDWEKNNIHLE